MATGLFVAAQPALGAEPVVVTRDIAYGPLERNTADLYAPEGGATNRPVLLLVHGGGFVSGDKSVMGAIAADYAARGWVCVSINYRFATRGGSGTAALYRRETRASRNDMLRAVRWTRAHARDWGGNPERVLGLGASAGGTLVALAATSGAGARTTGSRLWAAATLSAPTRMQRPLSSPLPQVDGSDAPMLVVHGQHEFIPSRDQQDLVARLQAAGVANTTPLTVESPGHALQLWNQVADQVDAWLTTASV